jgi:hypothetical protein
MAGTVIYATDLQTQEFLAELIETTTDRRIESMWAESGWSSSQHTS